MPGGPDPLYVSARRVLLDALDALALHRRAVILIGAQAIYLHTGEGDLAIAPYTTDGDIALNPETLADAPDLASLMRRAGFVLTENLGTWRAPNQIQIDLMVPDAVAGPGTRGARLGPHGNRVARRGRGLEAALVDNAPLTIDALEDSDSRRIEVAVAGPSALLVAKLHKITDRLDNPGRLNNKDAYDIYRLLQSIPTDKLVSKLLELSNHPVSQEVTTQAITHLEELFGKLDARGAQMAAKAVELVGDPEATALSCAVLSQDLLRALRMPRL